jgi:hypothetical protein
MIKKLCFSVLVVLILITHVRAAEELRIMVVISSNANGLYGSTLFTDIKTTMQGVMNQAGLPVPSFYKYPSYPQLIDPGLDKNDVFNIATLVPAYINARNDATADIVLFVLSQVNEPSGEGCGAAKGVPARKIDLVADMLSTHHIQNANTRFLPSLLSFTRVACHSTLCLLRLTRSAMCCLPSTKLLPERSCSWRS